jgi:hypothetical protein
MRSEVFDRFFLSWTQTKTGLGHSARQGLREGSIRNDSRINKSTTLDLKPVTFVQLSFE